MKHIKKKFLKEISLGTEGLQEILAVAPNDDQTKQDIAKIQAENFENHNAILILENGDLVFTFKYTKENRNFFIPEPNPILNNFHTAQIHIKVVKETREKLLSLVENKIENVHEVKRLLYHYVSMSSICITSMFNSLEAFINNSIPDNYIYYNIKCKARDKMFIQKKLKFDVKEEIIPIIFGKDFKVDMPDLYNVISLLKVLRDEVMHTTAYYLSTDSLYSNLYVALLDFDFEAALSAPDLIEECDCQNSD